MSVRLTNDLVALIERLQSAPAGESSVALVLHGSVAADELDLALKRAVGAAQEPYWRAADRGEVPLAPDPGEWDWVVVGDDVLIVVEEAERLQESLGDVVKQLELRGVEATLGLWVVPELPQPPDRAPAVICRMRLAGRRVQCGEREYAWQADERARSRVAAAAVGWVRDLQSGVASTAISAMPPVPVAADKDPLPDMLKAAGAGRNVRFSALDGPSGRAMALQHYGGVVLASFDNGTSDAGWRSAVQSYRRLLERHADDLVYGHAMATTAVSLALLQEDLPPDWPRRDDDAPQGTAGTPWAFEDLYAPDAFALQLLGPG